jgi:hypothetical protein
MEHRSTRIARSTLTITRFERNAAASAGIGREIRLIPVTVRSHTMEHAFPDGSAPKRYAL